MVRRFARPYARALMDVAGSAEKANAVRGELMRFESALRTSPELGELYVNPAIDMDAKLAITRELARKMKLSELAERMAEVLVRSHRMSEISAVLEAVATYVNQELGVAIAHVRSAKTLTPDEMRDLAEVLGKKTGKKVELEVVTDPTLLGGFVAKIGSEIWDASVAGRINKFRDSLAS